MSSSRITTPFGAQSRAGGGRENVSASVQSTASVVLASLN